MLNELRQNNSNDYMNYLRMGYWTFNYLQEKIVPDRKKGDTKLTTANKKLAAILRYLATIGMTLRGYDIFKHNLSTSLWKIDSRNKSHYLWRLQGRIDKRMNPQYQSFKLSYLTYWYCIIIWPPVQVFSCTFRLRWGFHFFDFWSSPQQVSFLFNKMHRTALLIL